MAFAKRPIFFEWQFGASLLNHRNHVRLVEASFLRDVELFFTAKIDLPLNVFSYCGRLRRFHLNFGHVAPPEVIQLHIACVESQIAYLL